MEKTVDIVVTWVDGSDPEWQADKNKYVSESEMGLARYRDWGLMRYWFRGVEKFAPWARKIFFVTYGHVPEWLDVANEKLVIVRHEDYIPREYLPTFSSHPIELNLHRIEGLSEKFVYFNDDMFLTSMTMENDFFAGELPKDSCIESAIMQDDYNDLFAHILSNTCAIINMHFDKHTVISNNRRKWFSMKYGKDLIRNIIMYPYKQFSSFKFYHLPNAYRKENFEKVWQLEPQILNNVCMHRFRKASDINQYIVKYYQFVTGEFVPRKPSLGRFYIPGRDSVDEMCNAIETKRYKMVCINDNDNYDVDSISKQVKKSFERILPEVSSFEIEYKKNA